MNNTIKRFFTCTLVAGMAILGSACGDSSNDFDQVSGNPGNTQIVSNRVDYRGQYDGRVVLDDGLTITSSFVINEMDELDGSFTVDPPGPVSTSNPSLGNELGNQPATGREHVLPGTYDLQGSVDDADMSASGQILQNGREVGRFFIDLTSGLTSLAFVGGSDGYEPETGLYPYPSPEDIQYFLEHMRPGTHRRPWNL